MDIAYFNNFLIACVGASSAFIGFLLVALSLVLARTNGGAELKFTDRRLAESSFTALANIFFVSFIALLPNTNMGYAALILAVFGLRSVWQLVRRFQEIRKKEDVSEYTIDVSWIIAQFLIYAAEGIYGIRIIIDPTNATNLYVMMGILMGLFGSSLVRIWELTGIRKA
jgi:hypothetical protein